MDRSLRLTLPRPFEQWSVTSLPKALRLPALWLATIFVHIWLIFEATSNPQTAPFNDVNLYGFWAEQVQQGHGVLGVSVPWVYPFVALGPILLAKLIGSSAGMLTGWLILICAINLIGVSAIVDWGQGGKSAFRSAAYYLAFIALLGPVAIGRVDSAATFLAMLGLVQIYRDRLKVAIAIFTLGAWVKIWPVAAAIALFSSAKSRISLALISIGSAAVILAVGFALGGNESLWSFVTTQGARGLQIESVAATFWVWAAKAGVSGARIYFDNQLVTNQVAGTFASETSALLGLVLPAALAITAFLSFRAYKAGGNFKHLFAVSLLTATLDLIVFNKVGSPQFELWLAVPLMSGILLNVRQWRIPLAGGALIALLTNLLYPVFYIDLMGLGLLGIWILTLRNLALVLLLIWANIRLGKFAR
jgi:hypothetical protein